MAAYNDEVRANPGFTASRCGFEDLLASLGTGAQAGWSADAAEEFTAEAGREVLRLALQGFFDACTARENAARDEQRIPAPADAAGIVHNRVESGHERGLNTVFGPVRPTRLAHRAEGAANLYLADAAWNLPAGLHSHCLAKLAVTEAVRGSFADAAAAITRRCGPVACPKTVGQLVIGAAGDFDAFYAARIEMPCGDQTLQVLSVDGKGIVMRPEALRAETRKAAQAKGGNTYRTRLTGGEKTGRKRMATLGALYDAEPAVRRPHDIIAAPGTKPRKKTKKHRRGPKARGKWLCGSVEHAAADVISQVFDHAEARDPEHRRTWIALVDGAPAQIDAINAEAATRAVTVHIIVDFVHVTEYLWRAAWCFHTPGDPDAEAWVGQRAVTILNGRCADVADQLTDAAEAAGLTGEKRKNLKDTVGYLTNKALYLRYDIALAAGWPIATGVIEGACRHLIADRLDITGARWGLDGAEAVLKLRALISNGDLEEFWAFHLRQEHQRNHQARYQADYALAT